MKRNRLHTKQSVFYTLFILFTLAPFASYRAIGSQPPWAEKRTNLKALQSTSSQTHRAKPASRWSTWNETNKNKKTPAAPPLVHKQKENLPPISADARIDSFRNFLPIAQLTNHYVDGFTAYKIQVINTNKRAVALEVARVAEMLVPDLQVYSSYREPYYRVRVGIFKTEMEAEPYRRKFDNYYKNRRAIITVPEQITLREALDHLVKKQNTDDFFKPLPVIDTCSENMFF